MHLPPLIQDLAVILGVAGLMSLIFQKIRQPVVLGYILAGMIVGPHTPPFQLVTDVPSIQTWAELGVVFLMFSLGLEFSFRKLAKVGMSAGITAGVEVLFFLPVGFGIGKFLGWSAMDSLFLGAMLAISSTTIIIKALDELKLKTRRFAELIFGVLIVEDLIAILLLVGLTTVATSASVSGMALLNAALKLILVVGSWFLVGYFAVPRFMKYVGKVGNNELVTLLSIGLCLGLVVVANRFHYSTALGAFIMGSILAESSLLHRIESRMESLRDLFGAIFFVSIGMLINPHSLWEHKGVIALLCVVTILGKVLSTGFGALASGQTFRNSVRVGFGLAQIGEFSFIIAGLGMSLGVTSDFIYPIAVGVSLVTTFTTPYLIKASEPIAERMEHLLPKRVLDAIHRYAIWNESKRTSAAKRKGLYLVLLRWFLNGLMVSAIFALTAEFLGTEGRMGVLGAWITALVLSGPFIWGMISSPRRDPDFGRFQMAMLLLFSFTWIAALSSEFFPATAIAKVAGVSLIVSLAFFYPRLESSYHWFEKKFLSTFDEHQSTGQTVPALAPWDGHLVRLPVHPNGTFAGKRLLDCQLRNRYGINVVAIQRGLATIVAPKPEEFIFPQDELLVLGTDEQIEKVRVLLESPSIRTESNPEIGDYSLKHVTINEGATAIVGQSIRNAGIREQFGAIVVGIERDQTRIMNPDSDLVLRAGDVLWLVGNSENLLRLQQSVLA